MSVLTIGLPASLEQGHANPRTWEILSILEAEVPYTDDRASGPFRKGMLTDKAGPAHWKRYRKAIMLSVVRTFLFLKIAFGCERYKCCFRHLTPKESRPSVMTRSVICTFHISSPIEITDTASICSFLPRLVSNFSKCPTTCTHLKYPLKPGNNRSRAKTDHSQFYVSSLLGGFVSEAR